MNQRVRDNTARWNWLLFGVAYCVNYLVLRIVDPGRVGPIDVAIEALGYTAAAAVPAFALQRWGDPRRRQHVWTVAISIILGFGLLYGHSHPGG